MASVQIDNAAPGAPTVNLDVERNSQTGAIESWILTVESSSITAVRCEVEIGGSSDFYDFRPGDLLTIESGDSTLPDRARLLSSNGSASGWTDAEE